MAHADSTPGNEVIESSAHIVQISWGLGTGTVCVCCAPGQPLFSCSKEVLLLKWDQTGCFFSSPGKSTPKPPVVWLFLRNTLSRCGDLASIEVWGGNTSSAAWTCYLGQLEGRWQCESEKGLEKEGSQGSALTSPANAGFFSAGVRDHTCCLPCSLYAPATVSNWAGNRRPQTKALPLSPCISVSLSWCIN